MTDVERFSEYNRLLTVATYILRFAFNARTKMKGSRKGMELTADELTAAEYYILRHIQKTISSDPKFDESAKSRRLKKSHDGLFRSRGRLVEAATIRV